MSASSLEDRQWWATLGRVDLHRPASVFEKVLAIEDVLGEYIVPLSMEYRPNH